MVLSVFCYLAGFHVILHILGVFIITLKSYLAYGWYMILTNPDNTTTQIPIIRDTSILHKMLFVGEDLFTIVLYSIIIILVMTASVIAIFENKSAKYYILTLGVLTEILVVILFIANVVLAVFYGIDSILGGLMFNVVMALYLAGLFSHMIRFMKLVNFKVKRDYVRINNEDEHDFQDFVLFIVFRKN